QSLQFVHLLPGDDAIERFAAPVGVGAAGREHGDAPLHLDVDGPGDVAGAFRNDGERLGRVGPFLDEIDHLGGNENGHEGIQDFFLRKIDQAGQQNGRIDGENDLPEAPAADFVEDAGDDVD